MKTKAENLENTNNIRVKSRKFHAFTHQHFLSCFSFHVSIELAKTIVENTQKQRKKRNEDLYSISLDFHPLLLIGACWSIGMKALKDCRWDQRHSILWRVRGGLDCHPETGSGYLGIQAAQRGERNGSWHALPRQLPYWRDPLRYSLPAFLMVYWTHLIWSPKCVYLIVKAKKVEKRKVKKVSNDFNQSLCTWNASKSYYTNNRWKPIKAVTNSKKYLHFLFEQTL